MSGESMANKVVRKIKARLNFLDRKNKYLTFNLRRLLCNSLIQFNTLQLTSNTLIINVLHYLNEVFIKAPESSSSLRNSYKKLQQLFRKTGQNALSFNGPALWNKIPEEIKRTTNLNAFKHNLKKHYLKDLGKVNF